MAEKEDPHQPKSLNCPLCLDAFKNPTLLRCGHTFCSDCLGRYDEQHQARDYMECPVCKKRTKLGHHRVAGLSPNFSVKGLKDEWNGIGKVIGGSSNFCSLHSDTYKDILCEDCKVFICLSCFLDKHQGHKIRKKEVIEAEFKKKKEAFDQKIQLKKVDLQMSINNAKQEKCDMHTHQQNLLRQINEAFDKKSAILQENKVKLSEEATKMCNDAYNGVKMGFLRQKKIINKIESDITEEKYQANECLHPDRIEVLQAKITQFENAMEMDINKVTRATKRVRNTRFHEADGNVLELGCLEQQANVVDSSPPQVQTYSGACTSRSNAVEVQGDSREAVIRASVQCTSMMTPSRGIASPGRDASVGEGSSQNGSSVDSATLQGRSDVVNKPTAVQDLTNSTVKKINSRQSLSGSGEGSSQNGSGVNSAELQGRRDVVNKPIAVQDLPNSTVKKINSRQSLSGSGEGSSHNGSSVNSAELQGRRDVKDKRTAVQDLPNSTVKKIDSRQSLSGSGEGSSQNGSSVNSAELQGRRDVVNKPIAVQDLPNSTVKKIDSQGRSGLGEGSSHDRSSVCDSARDRLTILESNPLKETTAQEPLSYTAKKNDPPVHVSGMANDLSQDRDGVSSSAGEIQDIPGSSTMEDAPAAVQNSQMANVKEVNSGMVNAESQDGPGSSVGEVTVQEARSVVNIPTSVQNMDVNIVKAFDLPVNVSGMAAAPFPTAVVVGYGQKRHGADAFCLSGSKTTYLNTTAGPVCDISFLGDGRLVVSHGQSFSIYHRQYRSLENKQHKFRCRQNKNFDTFLCVDQNGKVYGVNNSCKINVFNGQSTAMMHVVYPARVDSIPAPAVQICVTKAGAMVVGFGHGFLRYNQAVRSISVIRRLTKRGPLRARVAVQEGDKYLCAAIDTQDRVLVAAVKNGSSLFMLTRYILEGMEFTETTNFKPLRLPHSIDDTCSWCYMVSITPNLIAFATGIHLYFMQLPL